MNNRDASGRLLPGHSANPSGRPAFPFSFDKKLKERLSNDPMLGDLFVSAALEAATQFKDSKVLQFLWERVDGKLPSELAIKGIIIHVGDSFAQRGIEANKLELEDHKRKYLPMITESAMGTTKDDGDAVE